MKKQGYHKGPNRDQETEDKRLREIEQAFEDHEQVAMCEIDDTWEQIYGIPNAHMRKRSRSSDDCGDEEE